jgi:two-component SAPR family response regulator
MRRFFIPIIFLLCVFELSAQNYGLEFTAREKNADFRTELDLSSSKGFHFDRDFELSFDLLLREKTVRTSYFGYILRILNEDGYNIDLMHNKIFVDSVDLNMVFGQDASIVSYDFESANHFDQWITIRLRFNISRHDLEFILHDTTITQTNVPIEPSQRLKFIFGACNYDRFKTRDIPPFNLRDIKITVDDKLKYHWPLNEIAGTEAVDVVRNKVALVRNPNWIKNMHLNWMKSYEYTMSGVGLVAANSYDEEIYLIGNEELIIFSIKDDITEHVRYENKISLADREQAIYFPAANSICCYHIDQQKISAFDLEKREWHITDSQEQQLRGYRHHNRYLSNADSTLYIFGGYGYHEYKNTIQKVNLVTNEWQKLEKDRDQIYLPRYLAASGYKQDTIYILGGYGSSSGDQMINPQNFPELLAYSIKDNRFVHKYDLEFPKDDLVFGNAMIIDAETDDYYALAFSRFKVDNSLQLLRGNLTVPTIEMMGDEIPYTHYDTKSYVDLFYFPSSSHLVTYTGISDESGNTNVELHKLRFPPNSTPSSTDSKSLINAKNSVIVLMIVLAVVVYLAFHYVKKKRVREMDNLSHSVTSETEEWEQITNEFGLQEVRSSAIHCFGGFRVFDATRTDITGEFTPLLKELYLLLLLHTVKDDKGISSEKLLEILWFDKSLESARNNRAVNIAKLRAVLEKVGNFEITHDTGYWKIICYDPEVYNDYCGFVQITQSIKNPDKRDILKLIKIAGKGPFLGNVSYEWLDSFKSTTSDSIINSLIRFSDSLDIKKDAHLIIQMADCIFNFDSINEDAMILKCKSHHAMGSHSLPKSTYTKFKKEYKTLYGEDYEVSFADVINKSRSEIISA